MKTKGVALMVAVGAFSMMSGCASQTTPDVVAEGVIFSVELKRGDGSTEGFTRLNQASAVPGRNGSWNVDAYGRLTEHFLIITRPQQPELGPEVIPADRVVRIQFGDGGIKQIEKNTSSPTK